MSFAVRAEAPPIYEDDSGALRVGDSRVLLEIVIRAFQDGATPETIVQRYPTLDLRDVYAIVAYYLRHREEVEAHLERRERIAQQLAGQHAVQQSGLADIRKRLESRRTP
jgi:uncharacterized protein (DUF433 family)